VSGFELWKSNGTSPGTVLIKDIRPGALSSNLRELTNVNGTLFFAADNGVSGRELWKSNGAAAGTVIIKDINPGGGLSDPKYLTNVNGKVFFAANNGSNGVELWVSNGLGAGTVLVKNITSDTGGAQRSYPKFLINVSGTLFFQADNGLVGKELWKSDGTNAGTSLIKDILPGGAGSIPENLENVNGTLFFAANNGVSGGELWRSNGTPAGTVLVLDINPGIAGSGADNLSNINGTLFFSALDNTHGDEPWILVASGLSAALGGTAARQPAASSSFMTATIAQPPRLDAQGTHWSNGLQNTGSSPHVTEPASDLAGSHRHPASSATLDRFLMEEMDWIEMPPLIRC
jgi:ELWxxDGT repeat protein